MSILAYLVFVIFCAFGLAVTVVEKSHEWPIRKPVLLLRKFVFRINKKSEKVFDCTVCMSFWTALLVDIFSLYFFGYFLWPISGFATLGFTWFLIEFLNLFDESE